MSFVKNKKSQHFTVHSAKQNTYTDRLHSVRHESRFFFPAFLLCFAQYLAHSGPESSHCEDYRMLLLLSSFFAGHFPSAD